MQQGRFFRVLGAAAPALVVSWFLAGTAFGQVKWQTGFVDAPTTYDAGVDADADGTNDAPNVSTCTGENPMFPICGSGASAGDVCDPAAPSNCAGTGSCGAGAVGTTGGDGVTAGDTPTSGLSVDAKKSKCQIKGGDKDKGKGVVAQAKVTFTSDTVQTDQNVDASNAPIGKCQAKASFDPKGKGGCKKDKDCIDSDTGENWGPCLSGDEWWVQFDFIVAPPQTCTNTCVAGLQATSLGLSTPTCFLGTCQVGGADTGYLCDALGALFTCPMGMTCTAALGPNPTPDDSISFNLSAVTVYVNCPIETGLSFPMEVKKGKGKVKADLLSSFGAVAPDNSNVDIKGCYLHEPAYNPDLEGVTGWTPSAATPGAPAVSSTLGLGAYVGTATASCEKRPCPPSSAIIDGPGLTAAITALTGSPPDPPIVVNNPVSPILAVAGGTAGKL